MTSITVYHKPQCVQCEATTRKLRELGISFEEIDLTNDQAAFDRAISAGHRTAPVVVVDGEIAWSGYRPDRIEALARQEVGL